MEVLIKPAHELRGVVQVPGDKSISHRALMLAALIPGHTTIDGFLASADCLATAKIIEALGVKIKRENTFLKVHSPGIKALQEPDQVLDAGNSGTTMRLMAGLLAGTPFFSVLTGDDSLRQRPMARIIVPLIAMGAHITARGNNNHAPLAIRGGNLSPITHHSPVASAQVKSAILLAGLSAPGVTAVVEPSRSRDHTERMLRYLGAQVVTQGNKVTIWGQPQLHSRPISVPGDVSSAMFFIVAALIVPGSQLLLPNVGVNPTRTGALTVLRQMGARIELLNTREICGEPVADIKVASSDLTGVTICGEQIPYLIDEIPVLAVAAALASGTTVVQDAMELRYKETDRITAVVEMLSRMGVSIEEKAQGFIIRGGGPIHGAVCPSYGDHRMAMSAAVAGLAAHRGHVSVQGAECVNISNHTFFDSLKALIRL